MTDFEALLEQGGSLKQKLVTFGQTPKMLAQFEEMVLSMTEGVMELDDLPEDALISLLESFLFEWQLPPQGETPRERMLKTQAKTLSPEEKAILASWADRREGIFFVEGVKEGIITAYNLVDDITYDVVSNHGRDGVKPFKPRTFFYSGLVPLGTYWMLSGEQRTYHKSEAQEALSNAQELMIADPASAFRKPERLAAAREQAEEIYHAFLECFSSELIVVSPEELPETLGRFFHHKTFVYKGKDGKTVAERIGGTPDLPPPPENLEDAELTSVGLAAHLEQGLCLLPEYGTLIEAFETPAKAGRGYHKQIVQEYIEEPSVPRFALERLAQQDTARFSQMIQKALGKKTFDWTRDGAALLDTYKPDDNQGGFMSLVVIDTSRFENLLT